MALAERGSGGCLQARPGKGTLCRGLHSQWPSLPAPWKWGMSCCCSALSTSSGEPCTKSSWLFGSWGSFDPQTHTHPQKGGVANLPWGLPGGGRVFPGKGRLSLGSRRGSWSTSGPSHREALSSSPSLPALRRQGNHSLAVSSLASLCARSGAARELPDHSRAEP